MIRLTIEDEKTFISRCLDDFSLIVKKELDNNGISVADFDDKHELLAAYCALKARRVWSNPRRVHTASGLSIPDNLILGFDNLVEKFTNGQDVNCHLSRQVELLDSNDLLYYDWGISHFHIGTSLESDGFIKRTGPLVFAVVKPSDVYIITIGQHGQWANTEMISIIDSN